MPGEYEGSDFESSRPLTSDEFATLSPARRAFEEWSNGDAGYGEMGAFMAGYGAAAAHKEPQTEALEFRRLSETVRLPWRIEESQYENGGAWVYGPGMKSFVTSRTNATLIVAVVNALPALLDENERLRQAAMDFLNVISAAEALGWSWAGTKYMKDLHPTTGDLFAAHVRFATALTAGGLP